MFSFHYYYNSCQYFILSFGVFNIHTIPLVKNVALHIKLTKSSFSGLCAGLLALEMLTNQRSNVLLSKKPNLILKIRKGLPVGCKVNLNRILAFNFLETVWVFIMSRFDVAEICKFTMTSSKTYTTLNLSIADIFAFKNLEGFYFEFREYFIQLQVHINFQGSLEHVKALVQALKLTL